MDVTVPKKDLLRLVGRCQGVADKKSTMPALSNVLLSIGGPSELRVAATDLYLAISGSVSGIEVKKGGSVAVSAKDLYERIKMMPDGPIHVVTNDGFSTTLKAAASARRYTLRGMPGEDFPALAEPDPKAPTLELELDVLSRLISRTHFSISTDETRPALNSALFEWDGDRVRMVSTDGHRLSKMELRVPGRQATATMLIPLKAVGELRRLSDETRAEAGKDGEAQKVIISQSGPNAFFLMGGTRFSVKLVDAQFPPYSRAIAPSGCHARHSRMRSGQCHWRPAIAPAASSSKSRAAPCASAAKAPRRATASTKYPSTTPVPKSSSVSMPSTSWTCWARSTTRKSSSASAAISTPP